ncbi:hypothetical protein QR680_006455 [Steinernema hermaphroditum]|uniref:Phospholipid/glycerol acyltransferase domain-containing protein n=1 Tax=Steinernema hermaphroditum TaxID=289476 RepID=A0AA39LXF5_9BILA|nr:hypothetical protein QR680_006455 [Steinernema hermaphroditum]
MTMGPGEPPLVTQTGPAEKVRGAIFCVAMLFSALLGSMYILLPLFPLIFLKPRWWRKLIDRLVGFWLILPSGLMELIFDVKLTVTGDKVDHSEAALMIMNHRTRLDWLFYWNCLFRMDPWLLISEKITLKGILRFVPGAGWAMGTNAYLFLQRSFIEDKSRITKMLEYYAKTGDSYQILLFPEGTDKCPKATARMIQFAEEKQLQQYEYVLHPKTAGFVLMVQKMRELGYIKYLYDVTVAYNDAIVQSEVDLAKLGATPREIHFDVRKMNIEELPESDEGLVEWLNALWKRKEERLRRFYTQPKESRMLDTHAGSETFEHKDNSRLIQNGIVGIWAFVTVFWSYFWWAYPFQGFWTLFAFGVFVGAHGARTRSSRRHRGQLSDLRSTCVSYHHTFLI